MHANVWESCRDPFADKLPAGRVPEVNEGSNWVLRSGSWVGGAAVC
ncbi:MAG: hypothetical protein ACKV0T_15335 [Planctomycetales bacterium]